MQSYLSGNCNSVNKSINWDVSITSTSTLTGCRFWNCHTGVRGTKLFRFNLENAVFRSAQTTASLTGHQGERGLLLSTNRYQYYIRNNEFTNIGTCINIPIAAGSYSTISGGNQSGIYADRIVILQNTLTAGTSTTNYVKSAVVITCPNQVTPTTANDYNVSPFTKGIVVEQNYIAPVYRGIYLSGITGFQTSINTNTITLANDAIFTPSTQHAINLSNFMSATNRTAQCLVYDNRLRGSTSASTTSEALFYGTYNIGTYAPMIYCNDLSDCKDGFVFAVDNKPNGNIPGTRWHGNDMQNLGRGLVLTNTAVIGQQGNGSQGINNKWNGSWPTGTYGTWSQINTTVTSSPLYFNGAFPPSNDGNPTLDSYGGGPGLFTTSLTADFSCSDPTAISTSENPWITFDTDERNYLSDATTYRFLHLNDSIRTSEVSLEDFYDGLSGSGIDKLMQVEEKISLGVFNDARSLLADIDPVNFIEENYILLFTLYCNYLENLQDGESFSDADSSALYELASLCPENNGPSIYQAKSLYNFIFHVIPSTDCDPEARPANFSEITANRIKSGRSTIRVYPNPSTGQIRINENINDDKLCIIICDVSGRLVFEGSAELVDHGANLSLDLENGVYLLKIINERKEEFTKLIVISK